MTTDSRVYRLQLALGASGLAGAVLVLALGVSRVHVTPTKAHLLAVAGMRFTYPALNAAAAILLAFALLGAIVLVVTLRAALKQLREHRRLIRALPVGGTLPGHPTVSVVRAATPLAFCAGWVRPRIYVSTAAVEQLSETELRAVLAHEHHHLKVRDPLRLAIGRVLCQALFFLPVLRPLHARYGEVAELKADAAAVDAADKKSLASAMLAFSTNPVRRRRRDLAGADRLAARPAAEVAAAVAAAGRRAGDLRHPAGARLARERERIRRRDAQPADRELGSPACSCSPSCRSWPAWPARSRGPDPAKLAAAAP